MKSKFIILTFILFVFFLSYTKAQQFGLGNLDLSFCNDSNLTQELDLVSKAGEEIQICININNSSPQTFKVNIDFLDATLTQGQDVFRACNAADRPKLNFGNFVLDYDPTISIPGSSSIQKTFKIFFPIGFSGFSHGCVAYNIIQDDNQTDSSMLNIVTRKIKFVDIFVGETQVKSQIKIGSIQTIKSGNITNFQIGLKNIGNIQQQVFLTGKISNILGFSRNLKLNLTSTNIDPNQETTIQTQNENIILPFYRGFFRISFDISNQPNFNFNIRQGGIQDQKIILGGNFKASKIIFLLNPYFIIIALIFMVLIYLSFFKKPKIPQTQTKSKKRSKQKTKYGKQTTFG